MSTASGAGVPRIRTLVDDPDLVEASRLRLVEAATRLFRSAGFHSTSTRDIAREAGVSVGAIYQYIRHKEDLLVLILQSMVALHESRLFPLMDDRGLGPQRLWQAIEVYYRILDEHHERTHVLYHGFASLSRPLRAHFRRTEDRIGAGFVAILEQGIAGGEFKPCNVAFVSHSISAMGHMWALRRGRLAGQMTLDDYVESQCATLRALVDPRASVRSATGGRGALTASPAATRRTSPPSPSPRR